jgi:ubiquinone biosynthesis protein
VFALTYATRQKEIIDVVFRNGWDYMRGLLMGGTADEPQIPTPEVLRKILVELGPFYVKLGQVLSTRPDLLPPQYIEALSALQAQVPPVSWAAIETVIKDELKYPIDEIFQVINPEPVAAGSIGQIHRATLLNGEEVAIKILRPGIEKVVAQDSALIRGIAELVARTEFGRTYDIVNLADDFTKAVKAELDFRQEGSFTEELGRNLAKTRWFDPKQIVIPKVYWDISSSKILVLEWLYGQQLLDADLSEPKTLKTIQERRQEITSLLLRAFFQQYYIDGFFHADPHPGNIFYLQDGRVAILDCGMIGRLDPRTQQILTEMLLAIVDLDAQRCSQLTVKLSDSARPASTSQLEIDFERMLRKYYNLNLSKINFSEVVYEMLQIARNNKLRLPGNLGLYAKSLANLEGAGRKFNPEINLLEEVKPLMTDLFERQLIGFTPLQSSLRTILDLKSISLKSPRQIDVFLDRLTSDTLQWNVRLQDLDPLRRTVEKSMNRLASSIVIGSLTIGAAIISTKTSTTNLVIISDVLFTVASFMGLGLIISIMRSGRLK